MCVYGKCGFQPVVGSRRCVSSQSNSGVHSEECVVFVFAYNAFGLDELDLYNLNCEEHTYK